MQPNDTIIAVSSPPGRSHRGLIRMSGPGVATVLDQLIEDASSEPRQLTPVRLRGPSLPAMLLRFDAPASYTGEDLAELQLPGNAALLDRVLHRAINTPEANARLAEPGEFTFRAYTNGKLDLTQAEGVGATISAVSDSQLAASTLLRRGQLGKTAESLVDQLGNLLALVEAGIDFTDQEDVTPISPGVLADKARGLIATLDALLARSRSWGAIEALPRVVLVGPPSAGKSTLFNALLGRQRAVIDRAPGTTRDVLTEPIQLHDSHGRSVEVMLVDLAGLDQGLKQHPLSPDRDAQRLAREAVDQADLLLRLSDTPNDWVALDAAAPIIDVLSKCDSDTQNKSSEDIMRISARTGKGLDALRAAIAESLAGRGVSLQADLLALQPRHEAALRDAASELQATSDLLSASIETDRLPEIELLADSMRSSLNALASLGGRLTPDEIIGRVFATFCVGK